MDRVNYTLGYIDIEKELTLLGEYIWKAGELIELNHNKIREESMERQELVKNNIKIDELLDKVGGIISRIEGIINEKNYNHKNKTLLEENIIGYGNVLKKYTEGGNVLDLCI